MRGQIEGGAMQGASARRCCERVAYDSDGGQMISGSFMDYAMPRVDVFHGFKTAFDTSIPCKTNVPRREGRG